MKKFAAMLMAVGLIAGVALASEEAKTIESSSYNAETKVLTVDFGKGGTYEYAEVPQEVADAVAKAESKGKAINEMVKGKFKATKVEKK